MSGAPPRLLDSERRRSKAGEAGLLALVLLGAAVVNPDHPLPFDVCGFKYLTGLPCQTCGLTRALCHAMHAQWAQSVAYHPAGPLLAVALIGWTLWSAAEAFRGQPIAGTLRGRLGGVCLGAGVVLSAVSWIVRLALGSPWA